jgi:hypothetical protein
MGRSREANPAREVVALLSVCASRARVVGSGLAGVAATQDVGAR